MKRLLIATTNPGKLVEFRDLLGDLAVELVLPERDLQVVENGRSYAENAALKAHAYAAASGLTALADDSGLEVDALDGAPGLYSARYSPDENASDADRRALLLANLQAKPRPWTAHFHCTLAVAQPDGSVHYTQGNVYGEILPEERGNNGFGYDPLFLLPELGRTMAELTREEKNTLSHRALAVHAAQPYLQELLRLR
ncbi:non-canonical purine NTP pyrophosphatase, RdgB/HAM1 family [Longilinea arvoryzae]|uniref:dITP/XTP pyrophosphatase n=1 Tax=Longilinea arvoryzae TaxID=360412 RepID=A0A0S7BDN2_9CHLR|nr:RdgB/HAM1 family non-canonical purine NTP pyrophosphatase [Longilinea arvoryzae]GAP12868.1 non-canonical purine NTP pyrophosphatase, RdgB/HAM1 family [Longilinea arvoryzae]